MSTSTVPPSSGGSSEGIAAHCATLQAIQEEIGRAVVDGADDHMMLGVVEAIRSFLHPLLERRDPLWDMSALLFLDMLLERVVTYLESTVVGAAFTSSTSLNSKDHASLKMLLEVVSQALPFFQSFQDRTVGHDWQNHLAHIWRNNFA